MSFKFHPKADTLCNQTQDFPQSTISACKHQLYWDCLCLTCVDKYKKLSDDFFENNKHFINWSDIIDYDTFIAKIEYDEYEKQIYDFVIQHENNFKPKQICEITDGYLCSQKSKLSEEIIENNFDKIDFGCLCCTCVNTYNKLSPSFFAKHSIWINHREILQIPEFYTGMKINDRSTREMNQFIMTNKKNFCALSKL